MYENKMRRFRDAKGMTQAEVAEHLTIGQAEYARIEKGTRRPGKHLGAIAELFGVTEDQLLDEPVTGPAIQTDCEFFAFPTPDGNSTYAHAMHSRCPLPPYDSAIGEWKAVIAPKDFKSLRRGDLVYFDTGVIPKVDEACVWLHKDGYFRIGRYKGGWNFMSKDDEFDLEGEIEGFYKIMLFTRRFS